MKGGSSPRLRVLLVDGHRVSREGARKILEGDERFEIAGERADGASALRFCVAKRPDVVLLDLNLPDQSGLALARALRRRCPDVSVVIFTLHEDPLMIKEARAAGAVGYVSKAASPAAFRRAVLRASSNRRRP